MTVSTNAPIRVVITDCWKESKNTVLNTIHEKNYQPCHFVSSLVGGASTNLVNSKSSMTSPDILQVLKCGLCNGRGYEDVSYASIPCEACKGRGFHEEKDPD